MRRQDLNFRLGCCCGGKTAKDTTRRVELQGRTVWDPYRRVRRALVVSFLIEDLKDFIGLNVCVFSFPNELHSQ